MQKKVNNRFKLIIFYMVLASVGTYMILYNLEENITFFYPPSKINLINSTKEFRVGGLVKTNSILRINPDEIQFTITDNIKDLEISYKGILPALFREKQGVIAIGKLKNNIFIAHELLIKHDEYYLPPK